MHLFNSLVRYDVLRRSGRAWARRALQLHTEPGAQRGRLERAPLLRGRVLHAPGERLRQHCRRRRNVVLGRRRQRRGTQGRRVPDESRECLLLFVSRQAVAKSSVLAKKLKERPFFASEPGGVWVVCSRHLAGNSTIRYICNFCPSVDRTTFDTI